MSSPCVECLAGPIDCRSLTPLSSSGGPLTARYLENRNSRVPPTINQNITRPTLALRLFTHARYTFLCLEHFMANKHCVACGQPFQPRPQVPHQSYCAAPDCQRERRRQWQRLKLQGDPDYQDNQARAQQAWNDRNPDYWREYRHSHPDYVERNRTLQLGRNAKALVAPIAKMDVSNSGMPLPSGVYHLSLVADAGIAKMDVWTVEIIVHACECVPHVVIAKR
jgi:hypothetical protein